MSQVKLLSNEPIVSCRRFSLTEILLATNSFSDDQVIGKGGFGKVYKGLIDDGSTTVAIKRLNAESKQGAQEFWTEIITLLKLRYTHLVTLIGYSDEKDEMILVYEFIPNGTLAEHLYRISREEDFSFICCLTWEQRLNICIGAALGLRYLHENGIIHRDVKTTNILLDENFKAKIADFGLSRMTHKQSHVSTAVNGTFGYLDPEYFYTQRITMKSDVYAFGVVLLEVVCARPPVDTSFEEVERCSLALWAKKCFKDGTVLDMTDISLKGQVLRSSLEMFLKIALNCLRKNSKKRPNMAEVVRSLTLVMESERIAHQQKGIVAGLALRIARILRTDKPVNNVILDIPAMDKADGNMFVDTPATNNPGDAVSFWRSSLYEPSQDVFQDTPAPDISHKDVFFSSSAPDMPCKDLVFSSSATDISYEDVLFGSSPPEISDEDVFLDTDGTEKLVDDEDIFQGITATRIQHFTMSELRAATENFNKNQMITSGHDREVHRGLIDGGKREGAIMKWKKRISHTIEDVVINLERALGQPGSLSIEERVNIEKSSVNLKRKGLISKNCSQI